MNTQKRMNLPQIIDGLIKCEVYAIITMFLLKEAYSIIEGGLQVMLSESIKKARQKAFLSQDAFANELHVSVSTINRWETGKVKPNLTAMKSIKLFCEKYYLPYEEIEEEWFSFSVKGKEEKTIHD